MTQSSHPQRDASTGRFLTGNSGGGRPCGARNKLGDQFVGALLADFEQHGAEAIRAMRATSPARYIQTVAGILPRAPVESDSGDDLDHLSDDELNTIILGFYEKFLDLQTKRDPEHSNGSG